jgi:predicted AAA+ superfamily ATPase
MTRAIIKRKLIENLIERKNDPKKKPFLLRGARQVGKTWLVRKLGK